MLIKKIPDTSSLVTTTVLDAKSSQVKNKISDNSKYITTKEFNENTRENCETMLKQADLVHKKIIN